MSRANMLRAVPRVRQASNTLPCDSVASRHAVGVHALGWRGLIISSAAVHNYHVTRQYASWYAFLACL
jgi:hypothetical protein